jgi:hypothetical protein
MIILSKKEIPMGWIETLTKEAFIAAVREAVKPDLDRLEGKIDKMEAHTDARFEKLSGRVEGLAERVSRLEGTIEGSMRAYEANVHSMFVEFQRNIEREIFTRLLEDKKRPAT